MFPQSALIAFLLPLGLWLMLLASAQRAFEPRAAAVGLIALATSALAYLAFGFGLMFGGVGALSGLRQFAELSAYFGLPVDGSVWAIAGAKGFFLDGVSNGRALFVAWLPLAQACAVLVALPLWRRYGLLAIAAASALATLAFSIVGMATWGGGVGASMANQLRLGHGPIDFGGLGIAGLIAGIFSLLATRLRPGVSPALPESPHPLRLALGFCLAFIGAAGALAANPLTAPPQAAGADYAIAIVTASGIASLASLAYSVYVSRRPSIETAAASMLAALIAVSAGAMSLPIWAAVVLGLLSALSVIGGGFVWKTQVEDGVAGLGVPRLMIPAAAGLLLAGIAATGVYGAGVNGIGVDSYLGVPGLGVLGLMTSTAGISDPGQATAQVALLILGASVAAVLALPLRLFPAADLKVLANMEPATSQLPVEVAQSARVLDSSLPTHKEPSPPEPAPAHTTLKPSPAPAVAMTTGAAETPASPAAPQALAPKAKQGVQGAAPQPVPTSPPPTPDPAYRAPSLLERLRGNRPAEKPKAVGQARRVAYPVRVGGRRLILRAMPPENKPPDEAKDADQP